MAMRQAAVINLIRRRGSGHRYLAMLRIVFPLMLFCQVYGHSQGPQPPCGTEPVPPYPVAGTSPKVKFWSESELGRDWRPPACTNWAEAGFSTLTTTVARFRGTAEMEGLLRHFGAISDMAGMRYWSTTHKQWRTLIVKAQALRSPQAGQRRLDFMPEEMKEGAVLYFEQADNLSGTAIFRMCILAVSANRLVVEVENVSVMRYLLVTLFHAGEMQTIYFLDREPDGWRYYSMARTGRNASRMTSGHEASSINRAVAFYRFVAGIPTDQEPPAAR